MPEEHISTIHIRAEVHQDGNVNSVCVSTNKVKMKKENIEMIDVLFTDSGLKSVCYKSVIE